MTRKQEIKRVAKLINEFIDQELKHSRMLYEQPQEPSSDEWDMGKLYTRDLGLAVKGDAPVDIFPKYGAVNIPAKYGSTFIPDSGIAQQVIDHHLLRLSIEQHYLREDPDTDKLDTSPLLIYGAPGIGKSAGVREGAVQCAQEIADQKGLRFIQVGKGNQQELEKSLEEVKNNFYFVEWNITKETIKQRLLFGENNEIVKRIPPSNLFVYFDVRIAGVSEQDILGIPFRVDKTVKTPEGETLQIPALNMQKLTFLQFCVSNEDLHGIIMWDEINQGSDNIQSALYQIVLDRVVGDAPLPSGIGQFAAANGEMWGGGQLKPALASRFASKYLWVSPEEWLLTFDKQLAGPIKGFIKENPDIAFYVTDDAWTKHYEPAAKTKGMAATKLSDYIGKPELGGWPTPRDILKFNKSFKSLEKKALRKGWDAKELIEQALFQAGGEINAIWADHMRDYLVRYTSIKWEVLVNNKKAAMAASADTNRTTIVRQMIEDKFRQVYDLSKSPQLSKEFEDLLAQVFSAMMNVKDERIDSAALPISAVKETKKLQGEPEEKVNARILDIISKAIKIKPDPKWQTEARELVAHIGKVVSGKPPDISKQKQSFATNIIDIDQPQAFSTQSSVASGAPDIPEVKEKFSLFNSIFKEAAIEQTQEEQHVNSEQNLEQKQIEGITGIIQRVEASLKSIKNSKGDQVTDSINQAILSDNILTKEQKQTLITKIKNAPDPINALLLLKAYSTKAFILK